MAPLYKGFRFGMLLQLAVGPICLLVFNTASSQGFLSGLVLVAAIALVDAAYILLSGAGIARLMGKPKVQLAIKLFGCAVLVVFGLDTILGVFNRSLLPGVTLFSADTQNLFLKGVLLTSSNPLTILFWSGVFSAQVAENKYTPAQLCLFGGGCVASTLIFLSAVAGLGQVLSGFLPELLLKGLNLAVGLLLILFGIRLLARKSGASASETIHQS